MSVLAKLQDGYQNVVARLGLKTNNITSHGRYEFDNLINERMNLEYMYQYNWVARAVVDIPANDLTRKGVILHGYDPKDEAKIQRAIVQLDIWNALADCIKQARIYGGAVGYIQIAGQDPATPLNLDTISEGQFEGIEVLSRWQVTPLLGDPILSGIDKGLPKYYTSVFENTLISKPFTIHHSRVLRFIGIKVPWYSRLQLMFWGQSTIVHLHNRLLAYDAINTMIEQLSNKAHLRTLKIKGMREVLATGGEDAESMLLNYVQMMRETQSTEDITLLDGDDVFEAIPYDFTGLKDLLQLEGEQLSGASGIPQSKLFGRQESGLGGSHSGDLDYYNVNIESERERELRRPLDRLINIISRSTLGTPPPDDFSFDFECLEQLDDHETAELGVKTTNSIINVYEKGLVTLEEARTELKKSSLITKLFYDIDDKVPLDLVNRVDTKVDETNSFDE